MSKKSKAKKVTVVAPKPRKTSLDRRDRFCWDEGDIEIHTKSLKQGRKMTK
jgi:hypothetical protein